MHFKKSLHKVVSTTRGNVYYLLVLLFSLVGVFFHKQIYSYISTYSWQTYHDEIANYSIKFPRTFRQTIFTNISGYSLYKMGGAYDEGEISFRIYKNNYQNLDKLEDVAETYNIDERSLYDVNDKVSYSEISPFELGNYKALSFSKYYSYPMNREHARKYTEDTYFVQNNINKKQILIITIYYSKNNVGENNYMEILNTLRFTN